MQNGETSLRYYKSYLPFVICLVIYLVNFLIDILPNDKKINFT